VDAFHPENVGRIVQGRPRFLPCTPHGIQQLLIRRQIPIAGQHVVVLGRSDIVGKPMAVMLMQRGPGGDATVTVCHSRTRDLPAMLRQADILIVAMGQPKFVKAEMVKPGAVVIDVGINRSETGLVGDVDFEAVRQVAGQITPVPGGVGPLTIAMLLQNTLTAANYNGRNRRQRLEVLVEELDSLVHRGAVEEGLDVPGVGTRVQRDRYARGLHPLDDRPDWLMFTSRSFSP